MSSPPHRLRSVSSVTSAPLRPVLVAALFGVLLSAPARAQVNVERLRLDGRELGFTFASSLSLTLQSGNAEKQRAEGDARIDWLRPGTESFLIVDGDFDWTGGRRITNEGLLHLRHILRRGHRISPEAFGQINYDKARDLDFRALVGAGIRAHLHRGERGRASLGVAYMFEREELGLPADSRHPRETSHHRASSFLTVSFQPREGLALASTSYLQPRLDAVDDVRVLSQSRVAVRILGPFTFDVSLDLAYDADPPDGIEELDTALKMGLGIRF